MAKNNEWTKAEALKQIERLDEIKPAAGDPEVSLSEVICDNPEDFRMAIGHAQIEKRDHIFVTEKMFKYIVNNQQTPYITYGHPGIKVYKVGTKEEQDRLEKMTSDQKLDSIKPAVQ